MNQPPKKPGTEDELIGQTKKWLARMEEEAGDLKGRSTGFLPDKDYRSLVENLNAYIKDCRHFMKEKDWVRAFEAVIYAWGMYDACRRCAVLKDSADTAISK